MSSHQTILITGATSGIGRDAALHLSRAGHRVIATGRNQAALDTLVREADGKVHGVRLDVTDEASIARAVVEVDAITGGRGIDVLINNAGYGQGGAVLDVDDAALRAQFDTNVFGLLGVTRAFAAKMVARRQGRIVNISSLGGRISLPLMGVYNSTKFAVEALSDAMRIELAPFGVDVVVVQPGSIRTRFSDTMQGTVKPERTGPWAGVYERAERIVSGFERFSSGPEVISGVLLRVVEARRPRARYMAPFRETVAVVLGTWLPAFARDALLSRIFGIGASPVVLVRAAA